jgi:hypothetical protein
MSFFMLQMESLQMYQKIIKTQFFSGPLTLKTGETEQAYVRIRRKSQKTGGIGDSLTYCHVGCV